MAMSTVRLPQSELEKALASRPKHVFISGASRGIGEAVRVVRRLQKLGFMEEDCRVPDLGCSSTFRRRKN